MSRFRTIPTLFVFVPLAVVSIACDDEAGEESSAGADEPSEEASDPAGEAHRETITIAPEEHEGISIECPDGEEAIDSEAEFPDVVRERMRESLREMEGDETVRIGYKQSFINEGDEPVDVTLVVRCG